METKKYSVDLEFPDWYKKMLTEREKQRKRRERRQAIWFDVISCVGLAAMCWGLVFLHGLVGS